MAKTIATVGCVLGAVGALAYLLIDIVHAANSAVGHLLGG
jgi:hypothetical protein